MQPGQQQQGAGVAPPPMDQQHYQQQPWTTQQQVWSQPQYQNQPQVPATNADEVRTLWIGDLQYWMDENYIHTCFAPTGEVYIYIHLRCFDLKMLNCDCFSFTFRFRL